jgi:hypothetical protein
METLSAAAVKVDITPYLVNETYLAGFGPNRLATGVADPLTARILYLEDENGPLVWIGVDLIGLMLSDTDTLRGRLRGIAPERVLVAATHTHAGPDTMGLWGPTIKNVPMKSGRDEEYMRWMIEQIVAGVRRAQARKKPAVIGFGEDDSDKSQWTVNIRHPGFNDQAMTIMRVDGVDGRPIACLTNFACHPEQLWEMNTKISPDFVHYLHKGVEDATGAVSVFMNGALGGMVTGNLPDETPFPERKRFVRKMGLALGRIAADTWEQVKPGPVGSIVHRRERHWLPVENNQMLFLANLGIIQRPIRRDELETSIDFWQIGSAQFVTLPGEALPSVGFAAKERMNGDPNFVICLGNDELGYLVSDAEADDPNYAYERSMSIGPEATRLFLDDIEKLVNDK